MWSVLLELLIIIIPLVFIVVGYFPYRYRYYILFVVLALVTSVVLERNATLADIGIRFNNLLESLLGYGLFVVAGIITIPWYAKKIGNRKINNWQKNTHFLFLFIPLSVMQQFIFMAYTIPRLEVLIGIPLLIVFKNAVLFTALHLLYGKNIQHLFVAFVGGIIFSALYLMYQNLIISSLAHMVLNWVVVYWGFFITPKTTQVLQPQR